MTVTAPARDCLVAIVDAHALVASSLATALRHAGFTRVAAVDPHELEATSGLAAGDIVLVGLLYGDGRTALPLIAPLTDQGCRVLVMTADQGLHLTGECLHRGAETVLDERMSFEHLVETLRRLSAGGRAMPEDERTALLESVARHEETVRSIHAPFASLTEREAEVLGELIAGLAPKQIARKEGISLSTVRGHIRAILSKLDVNSQREALALARNLGWPWERPTGD